MKQVTYGARSVLLTDEAADMLLEYAAVLVNARRADTVTLRGLGRDGDEITVALLLNVGISLFSETMKEALAPPENTDSILYMRERVMKLLSPPLPRPVEAFSWDTFEGVDLYG